MSQFNQTQITIKFQTDNDKFLLSLLFGFWFVQKTVCRVGYEFRMIVKYLEEALKFYQKIFVIGFNSLVWGLR